MKVLIMHHVETMWEHGLRSFGTSLEEVVESLVDHLEASDYDRVILTRFEDDSFEDETMVLSYWATVKDYAYGWCRDSLDLDEDKDLPEDFVEGGNHSEIVYVPDWIKELAGCEVDLCGAFKFECLEDMEIALSSVKLKWQYLNQLCVG